MLEDAIVSSPSISEQARGLAAMFLAVMYFVLRAQLAARSGGVCLLNGFAVGMAGCDFKKPEGTPGREGRPMVARAKGADGSELWLETFLTHIAPVAARQCMVRDVNSPSGSPFGGTAWWDCMEPLSFILTQSSAAGCLWHYI